MHAFLIPLMQGLLAIFAALGAGKLFILVLRIKNIPWYWHLGLSAVLGQGAANLFAQAVLLSGHGSANTLRWVGWVVVLLGIAGHLLSRTANRWKALADLLRQNKFMTAILAGAWLSNLAAALAPSTKIDELFYHMLVPKRIIEDAALHFHRLPIEAAIVPQMHYQIALSIVHAFGTPDVGNVVSLGYSVVLILFTIGFLHDATGNGVLALMCGCICAVGIYGAVVHTTSGAHALGDLCMVLVVAGILRPASLMTGVGAAPYTLLLATATSIAGSTKITVWPLCFVILVLVVWRAAQHVQGKSKLALLGCAALVPWIVLHGPLLIWTYWQSGSPWGPLFANVLAPSVFPKNLLDILEQSRKINQTGLAPALRFAVLELSPAFFLASAWVLWRAVHGCRTSLIVSGLFVAQCALIAWKLPHDFRFLGGLQYMMVIAAILAAGEKDWSGLRLHSIWTKWEQGVVRWRLVLLAVITLPWLALQMYYVRPFAQVVTGLMPRELFMERYVAFNREFQMLDRTLPHDAVLYLPDSRSPNFYAPRPVVLTLLDLQGQRNIYRLTIKPGADSERVDATSILTCGDAWYQNDRAVLETYRTPGKAPTMGTVKIQRCEMIRRVESYVR